MSTSQMVNGAPAEQPLVIVSVDSHCGPTLDQLRPYCPTAHLGDFDDFARAIAEHPRQGGSFGNVPPAHMERIEEAGRVPGNNDMGARLHDMDADGVAAEIVYYGAQNHMPMPFGSFVPGTGGFDPKLEAVGINLFNRWLADWLSDQPHRHVGVAHLPIWDVDLAVAEARAAREAGLTSVNFPAPRPEIRAYNDPYWEPFWSVCEDLDLVLSCHTATGSGGGPNPYPGISALPIAMIQGSYFGRRGVYFLVLGGVFERHPGLRLVLTEQHGDWVDEMIADMDSVYIAPQGELLRGELPELPSTYFRRNVFIGDSFMSHREAEHAVELGMEQNFLWGSDYAHEEGTWPLTKLSLRATFAGMDAAPIRMMIGENAMQVYGLDAAKLREVADRIGPTTAEVSEPLASIPEGHLGFGFRTNGKWS